MKKIFISIAVIAVVALATIGVTRAYFSATETSSGNTFIAGTLDLTLNEIDGAPIDLTNMKPGEDVSGSMVVENVGSLSGWLGIRSSYVESDDDTYRPNGSGVNMGPNSTAKMLIITSFKADDVEMVHLIPNDDGDGKTTVYDMVHDPSSIQAPYASGLWYSYDTNMTPGVSHTYSLTVKFDENAGNAYQGDGIVWTFEFLLDQK